VTLSSLHTRHRQMGQHEQCYCHHTNGKLLGALKAQYTAAVRRDRIIVYDVQYTSYSYTKTKLRGLSLQANHTKGTTVRLVPTLADRGSYTYTRALRLLANFDGTLYTALQLFKYCHE
jgi:hypothetical protein